MPDDAQSHERSEELARWAAALLGRPAVTMVRRPGGGRHEAWVVEADGAGPWFIRADTERPGEHEHYTLRREAEIYRAVAATGVPVPGVLGVHPEHEAVLLDFSPGRAHFASLDGDAQRAVIADFAPKLAMLHAADPARLELPGLGPVGTIAEHVIQELDIWEARLDATGVPDPFLSACLIWLRDHVPQVPGRPSLVQGDTGPGNFLHDGSQVTAFLDFELAHLGDPMEDLAWVGTRNAQEPVPDFEQFLALYTGAGGAEPDRDRIRYHALFAELRIAILGAERLAAGGGLLNDLGSQIIYGALHRRLTVEALAAVTGTTLPAVALPDPADTPQTRYYDGALLQMREVVGPHVGDPFATQRLKSMARVFKFLREVDRVGGSHEQAELDDVTALLGERPATLDEGAARLLALVRARRLTAVDLLRYGAGQVARRHQLASGAMGVLATRHLPDF